MGWRLLGTGDLTGWGFTGSAHLMLTPILPSPHRTYFPDEETEAEVAVVRTLGPGPGVVSTSVGKRKQKERDVRRGPGGFLSEAGVQEEEEEEGRAGSRWAGGAAALPLRAGPPLRERRPAASAFIFSSPRSCTTAPTWPAPRGLTQRPSAGTQSALSRA